MPCNVPCRIILIVLNSLAAMFGLGITVLGGLLAWNKPIMQSFLNKGIKPFIQKYFQDAGDQFGDEILNAISATIAPLGIATFVFGLLILIVSSIGLWGACTGKKGVLYAYMGILAAIALVLLIIAIVYFAQKKKYGNEVTAFWMDAVNGYTSLDADDTFAFTNLIIAPQFKCCGGTNGDDYKNNKFTGTETFGGKAYTNLQYPVICCKMTEKFEIADSTCPGTFTDINSNIKNGCTDLLKTSLLKYTDYLAYALLVVFGFLVVLILFTLLTIKLRSEDFE